VKQRIDIQLDTIDEYCGLAGIDHIDVLKSDTQGFDLDVLRGNLKEAPGDGWEKLSKMAQEERALTKRVDAMLIEWAKLSEEVQ